jgi:hypothetical protein
LKFDCTVNATSDSEALDNFANKLNSKDYTVQDEPLYRPDRIYVTYEEVEDVTKVNIGETSIGVTVGQQSVGTR